MNVKNNYRALRAKYPKLTAGACLILARKHAAEGRSEYAPESGTFGAEFKIDSRAVRYCGNYAAAGFRLVGFADEVAPRAVDHKGWFTRHDGFATGETYRGAVFLIPARRGMSRAVIGYIDSNNDRAAVLECDIAEEVSARKLGRWGDIKGEIRDAAVNADGLAERSAEEAREYDTAWQAGAFYERCREEMAEANKEACEIIAAARVADAAGNAVICRTLRGAVADLRREAREALEKMRELREGNYSRGGDWLGFYTGNPELVAAFNDGAGRDVISD